MKLYLLNEEQCEEDEKYAFKVREILEKYKNVGQTIFLEVQAEVAAASRIYVV